jgi:hypothetical protein
MITASGLSFNAKLKFRNILTFFGILKGIILCVFLNAERFITPSFLRLLTCLHPIDPKPTIKHFKLIIFKEIVSVYQSH